MGSDVVLSYIDIHSGEVVPDGMVLHSLKQMDGQFVCRIYGAADNSKRFTLFGIDLREQGVDL